MQVGATLQRAELRIMRRRMSAHMCVRSYPPWQSIVQ